MQPLRPRELADWLADPGRAHPLLLDVREPWEFALCHLDGSRLVPMRTVPQVAGEFDASADIVVVCHHGVRSRQVALFLEQQGFTSVFNLEGGVHAWADEVDPSMPTY